MATLNRVPSTYLVQLRSSSSAKPPPEYLSQVEYFRIRRQHVVDRYADGYNRLVASERQVYGCLMEDHRDAMAEFQRVQRRRHRQMLLDFQQLCEADKQNAGLALEEEDARRNIYELWLTDYRRLLPVEQKRRQERVEQQTRIIQEQVAAARRAREAYEQHLRTTDEIDMCRREQTRGRMDVIQEWHDVVVVRLSLWHRASIALLELADYELWRRCQTELEEEETRALFLDSTHQLFLSCILEEEYRRLSLAQDEAFCFREDIQRGALETLRYELWWLVAKDVPRRWVAEAIT